MTHPHPQDSEQVAYLESVFRLDPADQIEDVLALRNGFFTAIRPGFNTVKPETTTDGRAVLEQRAQVQQQLDEIRRSFWEMEPEQTRARLDQLDVDESPDLKLVVDRVRNVLAAFHEVELIVKYKHCSYDFWNLLKEVLAASPRDSGRLQQSLLHWIAQDDRLRKQCCWTVKFIQKKCPQVAQIEAAFFKEVLQSRSVKFKCKNTDKSSDESWGGRVIVVSLGIWVAGMTWSGMSRSSSSPPKSRNFYSTTQFGLRQIPIETQRAIEGNSRSVADDNFVDRLARQENDRSALDDNGTTWPPRPVQRFDSFLDSEQKTIPPPRNNRGLKKDFQLPPEPYDSIPADSILKQSLESQPQNRSLIFR